MKTLTAKPALILIAMLVFFVALGEEVVRGNLKQAKIDDDMESARVAIAYINQMNYAYMVMETYHNVLAIREEYDKISLTRSDLTKIPSLSFSPGDGSEKNLKSMTDLILDMLDALDALKMIDEDYKRCQEVLEDNRRRAKKDMWGKIVASTPLALKHASEVIQKNSGKGDAYTVSAQAIVALAGDVIGGPVTAVMNYDKTLDEIRARFKDAKFTYERDKEKEVHKANKNLIKAESAFARYYKLKTEDVVNPDELKSLVETLKDSKKERVFSRLDSPEMRNHYQRFAPYWHYLASFAVQCTNHMVAVEAANRFFDDVYVGLAKNDHMVAKTAIAGVTALIAEKNYDKDKIDKDKVRKWLEKICSVNYNDTNPDYSLFCAEVYSRILNDSGKALGLLERANNNIERDFEEKLLNYRNKYSEGEIGIGEDDIPKDIELFRIRTLYNDILTANKNDLLKNIFDICANQTASSVEKLFYVGCVRVDDLWKEARKDVLAIKLRYANHWWANRFKVEIPVSWFLLGEVDAKVVFLKGTNEVARLDESIKDRTIRQHDAGVGSDIVTLTFICPRKRLRGVDSVKFVFDHKSWPIEITYKPSLAFDVQKGEDDRNKISEYVPVKIKFMGNEKDLVSPPENVKDIILCDKRKKHSAFLMPFQYGNTAYSTNFLTSISIDNNRAFEVAYTNPTPSNTGIDLVVNYYSRYGAKLCSVESSQKLKAGTGGTWKLPWPSDMLGSELPAHVLFQYHVDNEVWDRWVNEQGREQNAKPKFLDRIPTMEIEVKKEGLIPTVEIEIKKENE